MNWTIGASEVAPALGLSPYQSPFHWWAMKTGKIDKDESPSEAIQIGNALEEALVKEFERRYGIKTEPTKKIFHEEKKFLHATPDRFIHRESCSKEFVDKFNIERGEIVCLEIKTAGISSRHSLRKVDCQWGADWSDQIPQHYLMQTQQQIDVTNSFYSHGREDIFCNRAIVFALIGDRGFVPFETKLIPSVRDYIHEQLESIVTTNLELDIPLQPETADDWDELSEMILAKHNGKKFRIPASHEQAFQLKEMIEVKQKIKELTLKEKELKASLISLIGSNYALYSDEVSAVLTEGKDVEDRRTKKIVDDIEALIDRFDATGQTIIKDAIARHTKLIHRGRSLRVTKKGE
jgi:putative phage-type endonuclease